MAQRVLLASIGTCSSSSGDGDGDASKNPTCEAARGADFACVSQSRRWKNCSRPRVCPRPGNFGWMDGDGDGWIWVMGAKVSQKRVPQTKLFSCSFDPLAAWNAYSAMHFPKQAGLCYDVVPPATFQMVGYSFYVVLLVLKHVLPGFAMHCWNCLNVTTSRASKNSQWTQASKYPPQRSHTNSVLFQLFFDYFSTSADTPPKKKWISYGFPMVLMGFNGNIKKHQKSLEKSWHSRDPWARRWWSLRSWWASVVASRPRHPHVWCPPAPSGPLRWCSAARPGTRGPAKFITKTFKYLPSGEHTKSYGKSRVIVDFPIKNGGSFHGKMLVHQRVYHPISTLSNQKSSPL